MTGVMTPMQIENEKRRQNYPYCQAAMMQKSLSERKEKPYEDKLEST
jgi:hypothetical protein